MASFSVEQGQPSSPGRKISGRRMQVHALVVRMVLMLSVAATVKAVTVDNTMTELQMQHAARMALVAIAQDGFDDIGIASTVMALHPNGQMWPGDIYKTEEFTDGTVFFTVLFLDGTAARVGLQNIHHRDNTVSYENFGRTGLRSIDANSANISRGMRSGNGGSAAAGGSGAGSSRPASLHANPFREIAMRSHNARGAAAGGPPVVVDNTGGPPVVFRSAGSRVSAAPREAGSRVSASPRNAALGGGVASDPALDLAGLLDLQQQARRFQHERNLARLACSAAVRERNAHSDAHQITFETLMRRTAECNAMQSERDAALDANDARGTAVQEDTDRAEGKKRKVDNSAGSVDWEQEARTFENERNMALETRDIAIAARVAAEQAATFATQRAETSDLRATAAEHRVFMMQQEVQVAQAELAALRRAGASDDAACCNVKDEGSRN